MQVNGGQRRNELKEPNTNLSDIVEVTMWHLTLTCRLVKFVQQRMQLVLWWQVVQSTKTERLSEKPHNYLQAPDSW